MCFQEYQTLLADTNKNMKSTLVHEAQNKSCQFWEDLDVLSDAAFALEPFLKANTLALALNKVKQDRPDGTGPPDMTQRLIEEVNQAFTLYKELYEPFFSEETILLRHVKAILDGHRGCSVEEEFRSVARNLCRDLYSLVCQISQGL